MARAAMGFTVTGAVNGYAKNQLETIPYLAAMRCLSGRINEVHRVWRPSVYRRWPGLWCGCLSPPARSPLHVPVVVVAGV